MKRLDLIKHIERHGCALLREGVKHSVYVNRTKGKSSTVPRHREINDFLARKICKDLEIPEVYDAQPLGQRGRPAGGASPAWRVADYLGSLGVLAKASVELSLDA